MSEDRRREALDAAREAVEAHGARPDVQAVHTYRVLDDLKAVSDRLDQRIDEWPDPPEGVADLLERIRGEVGGLAARLERLLEEAAPNLVDLLGPNLAGAMVSEAGGLDALAKMPVSRVQVLGAKRAVLRAKEGEAPPKHGLLFLHPAVGSADRDVRGDRARRLARLTVLAARADAFTGRDLRSDLAEEAAEL